MYQDLNTRHDWPVKKKPIRLKANSKRISGNSVISGNPLGVQNKDFGDAL